MQLLYIKRKNKYCLVIGPSIRQSNQNYPICSVVMKTSMETVDVIVMLEDGGNAIVPSDQSILLT